MPSITRSASWLVTLAMLGVCILFGSVPLLGGWYFGFLAMTAGFVVDLLGLFLFIGLVGAFGRPHGAKAVFFVCVLGSLVVTYATSGLHDKFKARMYRHTANKYESMGKSDKAKEFNNKADELDGKASPEGK